MLDWLLIGGGIHGVHIAAPLIGEAGADPGRLRILDPGAGLLARWRACTAATGMSHLRSPSVHHLDLDPRSLDRFAGEPSILLQIAGLPMARADHRRFAGMPP